MNIKNKKIIIHRGDLLKLKKETGKRFKQFRTVIGKNQRQLAKESHIYQSTITNIELGKSFPCCKYTSYLYEAYNLNITWLITGGGDMFCREKVRYEMTVILDNIEQDERRYEQYVELLTLMQTPGIEMIIFGKLQELKAMRAFHKKRGAEPGKRKRKCKPRQGK